MERNIDNTHLEFIEKEMFIWGYKRNLLNLPNLIIDFLNIEKGGFSSIHTHELQYNFMYVKSGCIEINLYDIHLFEINKYHFDRGSRFTIQPELFHRFKALLPCEIIEVIYPISDYNTVSRDDIIRLTERGIEK